MKKRLLSTFLILTMVFSLVLPMRIPVSAASIGTALSGNIGNYTISEGGSYYLNGDVTGNITVNNEVEATLNLNGHVLKGDGTGSVITNNGTLIVTDSDKSTTHYFKVVTDTNQQYLPEEDREDDACLWELDTTATSGIAYESLKETPKAGTIIAVKGGVITGGVGTYIDGLVMEKQKGVYGGGILSAGALTIDNVTICGNTLKHSDNVENYSGAGVFIKESGSCTIKSGTSICGNAYWGSGGSGGGVSSCGPLAVEAGCSVSFNSAYDRGGGILSASATTLTGVTISSNNAGCMGGGIWVDSNLTAENIVVTGNSAKGKTCTKSSISGNGGGIFVNYDKSVTITESKIFENLAKRNGGGVFVYSYSENGNDFPGKAIMTDVEISGNKAANGGGITLNDSAQLLLKGCTVKENSATGSGGGIYKPGGKQSDYEGSDDKCVLLDTEVTHNAAGENGGGGVYFKKMVSQYESCFVAGTLISMADGSTKKIEDVVEGDIVKTFDHESGTFSSERVYLSWKERMEPQVTFKLNFDGGMTVHCVAAHTFLEKESRKYKTFNVDNAESYKGKYFFGEDGQWHKLLSVSVEEETEYLYEIYTSKHQNAFTNGMLSAPADIDYLLNIYELDEKLKADETQLAADIQEYGLVTFEKINELCSMNREWYEDAGAKYLFIAIGKGLTTREEVQDIYEDVNVSEEESPSMSLFGAASMFASVPMTTTSKDVEPALDSFDAGVITVGTGTRIVDNTVNSKDDNLYLGDDVDGEKSLITLYDTPTDILVGVTTEKEPSAAGPVQITTNGSEADEAYFFADKTSYVDKYYYDESENKGYLVLTTGSNLTCDPCENGVVSVGYSKSFYEGETVTVTAIPDDGYVIDRVYYNDGSSHEIVSDNGLYSFTMPTCDVTVNAIFKPAHIHQWVYFEGSTGEVDLKSTDTDIPSITTTGLVELLRELETNGEPGDNYKIKFIVEVRKDNNSTAQRAVKKLAGDRIVKFLDMRLSQSINGGGFTDIGSSNKNILNIEIPFDMKNKINFSVLRYHDGKAEELPEGLVNAVGGEYFEIQAGKIMIHAKKFSDYAVAYDEDKAGSAPKPGEGYTLNYNTFILTPKAFYEISEDKTTTATSLTDIDLSKKYYVRKAARDGNEASEWTDVKIKEGVLFYEKDKLTIDGNLKPGATPESFYDTLDEAIQAAKDGDYIKLINDIERDSSAGANNTILIPGNKNVLIDLNGCKIYKDFNAYGGLTLLDSKTKLAGSKTVIGSGAVEGKLTQTGNVITIKSGSYNPDKITKEAIDSMLDKGSRVYLVNGKWIALPEGMNLDFTLEYRIFTKDATNEDFINPASSTKLVDDMELDNEERNDLAWGEEYQAVVYLNTGMGDVNLRSFAFSAFYPKDLMDIEIKANVETNKYTTIIRNDELGKIDYTLATNNYKLDSTTENPVAVINFKVNGENVNPKDTVKLMFSDDAFISTMDSVNEIPVSLIMNYEGYIKSAGDGVVLIDYAYAPEGYKLAIISEEHEAGTTVRFKDNTPVYYTMNKAYVAQSSNPEGKNFKGETGNETGVYLAFVKNDMTEKSVEKQIEKITGNDIILTDDVYTGDIDRNGETEANDASLVYQMLTNNEKWGYDADNSHLYIPAFERLISEANHDGKLYGTIEDVNAIINIYYGKDIY